jgi:hypothetical protein
MLARRPEIVGRSRWEKVQSSEQVCIRGRSASAIPASAVPRHGDRTTTSVIQNGKPRAGVPQDHPWMWTITGAIVAPGLRSHGFRASLDEAEATFAETWRAWLALNRYQIDARSKRCWPRRSARPKPYSEQFRSAVRT